MLTSICGINWGDEGKGRMVDLLSRDFDVVCRYQGGNNAGHTVINEKGKFILNLLPSGILREDVVNVMGPGMVIDLKHLCNEIAKLREGGIAVSPENLKILHHLQIIPAVRIRVISQKPGSDVIALSFADNPAGDQIQLGIRAGEVQVPAAEQPPLWLPHVSAEAF